MSAAHDIPDAKKARVCSLLRSMGLGDRRAAELLRELSEEIEPSERFRRLQIAREDIGQAAPAPVKSRSRGAERTKKSRQAKKLGLRVLRSYPLVDDERLASLAQGERPMIAPEAFERDEDLVHAIVDMAHRLGDAAKNDV